MNATTLMPKARIEETSSAARPAGRTDRPGGVGDDAPSVPIVEIVVPVHNEERSLERSVRRLAVYVAEHFPFDAVVTIVDNGSTDRTLELAQGLAERLPNVEAMRIEEKGRGAALRAAWAASTAEVVAYMDVDLSTNLNALLPLVAPLLSGHSDVAIGSRLAPGARVQRGRKREFLSRAYNRLLRLALHSKLRDAQCGFKAVRTDVARRLLPHVDNDNWFFDTEILVLAQRNGLRIHEVPVDWIDDPDSSVDIAGTVLEDLRGIWRLRSRIARGRFRIGGGGEAETLRRRVLRFLGVGVVCTLGYLGGFAVLATVLPALWANAVSLIAMTILNTALNRRWTFGIAGRHRLLRDHVEAGAVFLLFFGFTTAALVAVDVLWPRASQLLTLSALLVANAAATLTRFAVLQLWVFHPRRRDRAQSQSPQPA